MKNQLFAVLFLIIGACNAQSKDSAFYVLLDNTLSHSAPRILVKELVSETGAVILDAREKEEYEVSHIQGAVWVGYDDFSLERVMDLPKDTAVVIYCSVGVRSEQIAEKLKDNGFVHVSNLYGGIFEWVNQGHPVYRKGQITKKIHPYSKEWGIWLQKGEQSFDLK